MATEPSTARGMSRLGLRLSPEIWIACSKPSSAKMMPLELIAASTPLMPNGAKPCEVKFEPWKLVSASTKIVSSGTKIFSQVAIELVWASTRTPRKLTATKTPISRTATMKPLVVRVPLSFRKLLANSQCPAYPIMASTSIGATVAACSQENQPKDMPARPPKA